MDENCNENPTIIALKNKPQAVEVLELTIHSRTKHTEKYKNVTTKSDSVRPLEAVTIMLNNKYQTDQLHLLTLDKTFVLQLILLS